MMITTRSSEITRILALRRRQNANQAYIRKYKEVFPVNEAAKPGSAGSLNDGAWAGETCFIVGGGPSLIGFDFERLRGRGRIIAINRAYEFVPFADIHYFMDNKYYRRVQRELTWREFKGVKVYLNMSAYRVAGDVISIPSRGRPGLSRSIGEGIYHGGNSGAGAIGLAYCLGANPIYLLGYDCKRTLENTHFHSGYGVNLGNGTLGRLIPEFNLLAAPLRAAGVKVVNLNPDSAIRCFPFSTFEAIA